MRSVPSRATERVISWIGKGLVMFARSSASQISGRTPSSLKVVTIFGFTSVLVGPCGRLRRWIRTAHMRRRRTPPADCRGRCRRGAPQLLTAARCASVYRYAARMTESPAGVAFADPQYRAAVVDLLGAIAYGEVSAFERLAEDSKLAPTLEDKVALAAMASAEFGHLARLRDRLTELGADPFAAMAPFQKPIDEFHEHTAPSGWLEGLVKAYVGDGLARDFYREI